MFGKCSHIVRGAKVYSQPVRWKEGLEVPILGMTLPYFEPFGMEKAYLDTRFHVLILIHVEEIIPGLFALMSICPGARCTFSRVIEVVLACKETIINISCIRCFRNV